MIQCPFYGRVADLQHSLTLPTGDDRCGLIVDAYRPCMLTAAGEQPELCRCERNGSGRAILFATFTQIRSAAMYT